MAQLRHVASGIALLATIAVGAHEDTSFRILWGGQVTGVPDEYLPARLLISRGGASPEVDLTLSGVQRKLPPCLSKLFALPAGEALSVSGSWYHARSTLPPYLAIRLPQRTSTISGMFEGYSLLFSLETAELLIINRNSFLESERHVRHEEVAPSAICGPDELDSMKPRPAA